MSRCALLLLALAAPALAGVEAPLGPYARPGVPVLLRSERPVEVDLDGWRFRVDGVAAVFPPALPCVVRDEQGAELLRLEDPGEGRALAAVIGEIPPDLGGAVQIDPTALGPGHWRALDLFDRVRITAPLRGDEPWIATVVTWTLAGGSLATADAARLFPDGTGLGAVAARGEELPPPRIPRPGNVRPDVYAQVLPVRASSPALRAARWVVLGAALACALQLLLAWRGRLRAATLLWGLAVVAVLGALAGMLRARAEYTPLAAGRIEIAYFGGGVERRRTYLAYRHAGPGAVAPVEEGAAPILFGANRSPWWKSAAAGAPVEEGIIRLFLVEELHRAEPPVLAGGEPPDDLWTRERPRRGTLRAASAPVVAPAAEEATPLLLGIRAVVQD